MYDSEIVYSPSPEIFKYNLDDYILTLKYNYLHRINRGDLNI